MRKDTMRKLLYFAVVILLFILLYWPSTQNQFFQDDFLLLDISQAENLSEVVSFMRPIPGFPYRPLTTHGFYFFVRSLFGLNSKVFHFVTLLWFMINAWLVYKIFLALFENKNLSLLGIFFYALSPVHYMTFFWIATFYFAQGATFFFASFYLFLKYKKTGTNKLLSLSLISYLIGSLSNEIVLFLPGLLFVYELCFDKRQILKTKVKRVLPFIILGIFLLVFRLKFAGLPEASDYALKLDFSFFSTLRWYILRVFGLPEGVRFIEERNTILVFATLFFLFLIVGVFAKRQKGGIQQDSKNMYLLGASWFILGALPFFFLPSHLSSYYMEISIIGAIIIWLTWLEPTIVNRKLISRRVITGLVASYIGLTFLSVRSMQSTHWVSRRGLLSGGLINQIKKKCAQVENVDEKVIEVISENREEAAITMSGDKAVKVICNDQDLLVRIEESKQLE